ncbi:MAG: radical SAM protein [Candidatus Omnitrophota bacterium]
MKQSKYNIFYKLDNDKFLAFNTLKNGLAEISLKIVDKIRYLEMGNDVNVDNSLVEELLKGGFICEDDYDEFRTLIIRRHMRQYFSGVLGLVIAPTLDCNMSCSYCFERPSEGIMNDSVMENLFKFIQKYIDSGIKEFAVTWFGGEPLLSFEVIEKLSEKFIAMSLKNKIDYSALIITNGTLYTKNIAKKLKSMQVRMAQITLDGDKVCHDQRRPFKNGKGTFDQIINNIQETVGIIPIHLRVNVNKSNANQSLSFFENLKKKEWFKSFFGKMISISYGYVQKYTDSCRCSKEETLNPGDFWKQKLELYRYLNKNGYGFNLYPSTSYGCTATSINSYVVGPEGELYKCWNDIGDSDNVVGTIFKPIELNSQHILYLTESFENDEECRNCKFLPICMGGCVDIRIKRKKGIPYSKYCTEWKYYLEDALREYYMAKMAEKKISETEAAE